MLIDTHAHLNFPELADAQDILDRATNEGVNTIVNIGTNLDDSKLGTEIADKFPNVYTTVGIHPNDSDDINVDSVDWEKFENLTKMSKVVAIGECGLDFSRIPTSDSGSQQEEKKRQKKLFLKQIEIAGKLALPLSIHIRDAYNDMLEIASKINVPAVFHCMSGTPDYLLNLLRLSPHFYFSFAGNITFKNAGDLRILAKLVPSERLLVETDCPFLSPEPHRGKRNEPANVRIIAEKLAEVRETEFEEIAAVTTKNAKNLFKI